MKSVNPWKLCFCIAAGCFCIFMIVPSYSGKLLSPPGLPSAESHKVDIFDEKGELVCTLQEDDKDDNLFLLRSDGVKIPCGSWEDKVKHKTPSPEGQVTAIVYVRNCGATTDFSTCIDLVSTKNSPEKNDTNTVFVMKGQHSVEVEWGNHNTLLVRYPQVKEEYIYRQQTKVHDIVIEYSKKAASKEKTMYLEIGIFNYGLTGVASGHCEETLLRMAGWSQIKSGLTRQEWGNWYGDPPYGDDPNEQLYIKQGFEFYRLNRDKIENTKKK
jgi:hypothetical protein